MNTYQVTLYSAGSVSPFPQYTVQAHEFAFTDQFVLFLNDSTPRATVLAVPLDLNPVINLTASA